MLAQARVRAAVRAGPRLRSRAPAPRASRTRPRAGPAEAEARVQGGARGGARVGRGARRARRPDALEARASTRRAPTTRGRVGSRPASYDALYGLGVCHSYRRRARQGHRVLPPGAARSIRTRLPRPGPRDLAAADGAGAAAVTELEAARRRAPDAQAYYLLGRAYQTLGRAAEAEAAFARVQELARSTRESAERGSLDPRPDPPYDRALLSASMRAPPVIALPCSSGSRWRSPRAADARSPDASARRRARASASRTPRAPPASPPSATSRAAPPRTTSSKPRARASRSSTTTATAGSTSTSSTASTFAALRGTAEAPSAALFRNNRDGTFTDVTAAAGVANRALGAGRVRGRLRQRRTDRPLRHELRPNRLYRNARPGDVRGRGRSGAGVAVDGWSTGCAFGDYDGDGQLDLFVAGYVDPRPRAAAARRRPAPAARARTTRRRARREQPEGHGRRLLAPAPPYCEYRGQPVDVRAHAASRARPTTSSATTATAPSPT